MEGMPDLMTCGSFCFGGVAALAIIALVVTRKTSAPLANGKARPFAFCGPLSATAPVLGGIALALFSSSWDYPIDLGMFFGAHGPTDLVGMSQTIMGCAGFVGFVLACMALARHERYQGFGVLGLLVNGPFMFMLFPGLGNILA